MPENDILNVNTDMLDDFELPPLPKRPVKVGETVEKVGKELSDKEIDAELPPLPEKTVDNSLDAIKEDVPADTLKNASEYEAPDNLDSIDTDDDLELPPLPEVKKEEKPKEEDVRIKGRAIGDPPVPASGPSQLRPR